LLAYLDMPTMLARICLSALLMVSLSAAAEDASGVRFAAKDGWIRAAPPGATALAGYVTLSNDAERSLVIVNAESSAFDAVAFHQSYEEGGMMRMRAVGNLDVPAKGELALAPGGLHLMLLRPKRTLGVGDSVIVDLVTDEGDPLPVVLRVRAASDAPAEAEDHSHHH